jgi:hypothetical protein
VLEATTYPDLGVIVRALGPIAFGSHGPRRIRRLRSAP